MPENFLDAVILADFERPAWWFNMPMCMVLLFGPANMTLEDGHAPASPSYIAIREDNR